MAPDVGGGFGLKEAPFPEYVLAMIGAKRLGKPVLWMAERGESFLSDFHARDNYSTATLGLDADGHFLALKVDTIANIGAYISPNGLHVSTNNLGGLAGVYRTPHIHTRVTGIFSNTPADRALSRRRTAGGDLRHRARDRHRGAGAAASIRWNCGAAT